jgi:hypothetical protein
MTVETRAPERNARIAATISSGLRPASDAAAVAIVRSAGWQPEQALAPAGGSAEAAIADAIDATTSAVATIARVAFLAAALALSSAAAAPPTAPIVQALRKS